MNIPAYTKLSAVLGPPFSVVGNTEFQILHDFCFQRVVERGNTVADEKLPDYSRNFTDEQYALGPSEKSFKNRISVTLLCTSFHSVESVQKLGNFYQKTCSSRKTSCSKCEARY